MKRNVNKLDKCMFLMVCLLSFSLMANAQVGSLLQKAAKKAVDKTAEKVIDKTTDAAADAASKAVENQVGKVLPASSANSASQTGVKSGEDVQSAEPQTFEELMRELPELPTVQQYVNYKTAEMREQKLKMFGNPVWTFNFKAATLGVQALRLAYENADSAHLTEAAYKNVEAYTGLSKEEIEKLAVMSEEEQEAYLQTHYQQGKAEAALLQQSEEAAKYLEPLQPQIDRWESCNEKVEAIYSQTENKCREIYRKYAGRLEKAGESERNDILISYYSEIIPLQRQAVQQALQLRLKEQLPIAEEIEKEMVKIRASHQDMVSALLNYPQMTAGRYFAEVARLMEIPRFEE